MMAPNWSVKAEALYYDLGSVTVTPAPLTTSINPITAAIPATLPIGVGTPVSTASVSSAINKLTGAATVSNVYSRHFPRRHHPARPQLSLQLTLTFPSLASG